MKRRYRITAEVSREDMDTLSTVPRHSKVEVLKGLLRIFIHDNPDKEEGKINWSYAQDVARGNYRLVRKETS